MSKHSSEYSSEINLFLRRKRTRFTRMFHLVGPTATTTIKKALKYIPQKSMTFMVPPPKLLWTFDSNARHLPSQPTKRAFSVIHQSNDRLLSLTIGIVKDGDTLMFVLFFLCVAVPVFYSKWQRREYLWNLHHEVPLVLFNLHHDWASKQIQCPTSISSFIVCSEWLICQFTEMICMWPEFSSVTWQCSSLFLTLGFDYSSHFRWQITSFLPWRCWFWKPPLNLLLMDRFFLAVLTLKSKGV